MLQRRGPLGGLRAFGLSVLGGPGPGERSIFVGLGGPGPGKQT